MEIIAKNTDEQIQQWREDQKPTRVHCQRCKLRAMMTIDEYINYVENCKICLR